MFKPHVDLSELSSSDIIIRNVREIYIFYIHERVSNREKKKEGGWGE